MELLPGKVGPEHIGNVELRIGRLPQQEVGQAQLSAGADNQLGVGDAPGVEVAAQLVRIQVVGVGPPVDAVLGEGLGRPDQLVPAAIVETDVYLTALVMP